MITTEIKTITPKYAAEILDEHYKRISEGKFIQRNVSHKIVDRYAADMRCGNWMLSPNPISFDENGDLIDGQHRLEAVRRSGKPVPMQVSTGWPAKSNGVGVIDCIDRGRPRSISQQLSLHGVAFSTAVAASVASAVRIVNGGSNVPLSYGTTVYILDRLGFREHIERYINMRTNRPLGRMIGVLAYYRTARPGKADEFTSRLLNMEFEKGTPPWLFAKYMRDGSADDQKIFIRSLCTVLRAWDANENISYIRPGPNACEWMAKTNPKLREQLIGLVGLKTIEEG